MGRQYERLSDSDIVFIGEQRLFYIASSSGEEVNLSPKGYDSIRVLDESTLLFLDYPGSGNRTARDIEAGGEVTVVFNAFEGPPNILRLFCKGELIEKYDAVFSQSLTHFDISRRAIRRIIRLNIYAVESSCGMSVPEMEYKGDRNALREWAEDMSESGDLKAYIEQHETPPDLKRP